MSYFLLKGISLSVQANKRPYRLGHDSSRGRRLAGSYPESWRQGFVYGGNRRLGASYPLKDINIGR